MADTTLSIGVVAELGAFKKSLSEIPGIGAQEARDLAAGIRRELGAAERAAASAAKGVSSSWRTELSAVEATAKKAFERIGGSIGPVGSAAVDLAKSFGAVGVAAGGAAAVGGGLAIMALSLDAILDSALAADQRLTALGITVADHAALQAYSAATSDLDVALDELRTIVGGALAEDLTTVVQAAAAGVRSFTDLYDSTEDLRDSLTLLQRAATAVGSLGLSELALSTLDSAAAANQAVIALDGLTDAQRLEVEAQQDAIEGARQQAIATRDEAAATAAATAAVRALEEERRAASAAAESRLAAELTREKAYYAEVDRALQAYDDSVAASAARQAAEVEASTEAQRQAYLDLYRAIQEERRTDAAEADRIRDGMLRAELDLAAALNSAFSTVTNSIVAGYERRAGAGEQLTESEKRAAMTAYTIAQGLAVAQATISAVVLASNIAASLSYVSGPFAVGIGVATAGAFLAAQLATIASTPPPEFPGGLSTPSEDHRLVGIQEGELIASRRAAATPGLAEAIASANAGRPLEGQQRPTETVVHVSLDRRLRRLRVDAGRPGKRSTRRQ